MSNVAWSSCRLDGSRFPEEILVKFEEYNMRKRHKIWDMNGLLSSQVGMQWNTRSSVILLVSRGLAGEQIYRH